MNLSHRIELLVKLGQYITSNEKDWQKIKEKAFDANPWFLPEFIEQATKNIAETFLQEPVLKNWVAPYPQIGEGLHPPRLIGIVMAGNIPLVGFHDFLSVFITGNKSRIKASSKDEVLIHHLVEKLISWQPELENWIQFGTLLKGCDAYIATGSATTAEHFRYYFGKYPHLIRHNRTSVAILDGNETPKELEALADDVFLYFGMGCRNVTKLYVPNEYPFEPLIELFKKYNYFADLHKYKNNYDYNLALHVLNKQFYMSTGSLLLIEHPHIFSPVGQLHYEYYTNKDLLTTTLKAHPNIQCIVGKEFVPWGMAQCPAIDNYADGENTLQFLVSLALT